MKKIFKRKTWMQAITVILVLAMNLGAIDGIANSILKEMYAHGLTKSLVQVNSVPIVSADPGEGSFSPSVFDPNHGQTSTLTFKFDYDHYVKIELYKGSKFIDTLSSRKFFNGRLDDPEDETPENVTNHYTWNGKDGGEPVDDGTYTIILTPLDDWSKYPLDADVRVRNVPHTPVITGVSINQDTGTVTLSGTSQPGHTIHLSNRGSYFFSTTADSAGRWWAYNKVFEMGEINVITAKAENKVRKWPTLSSSSAVKSFLTYQIRQNDKLWNISQFYLGRGNRYAEIQQATGLKNTTIYARKWLLIMNPARGGVYSNVDITEKDPKAKTNGQADKNMGDPINSVTGNYYTQQTDMLIPGRGLPFEFTRTYNSQSGARGQMGYRWDFSFNKSLLFYDDGTVGYARGDGGIELYIPDGNGNYISPVGVYDTLCKRQDETFYLTLKDRTVYNFDIAGRLVSMVDRHGNTVGVSYNDDGQIAFVTDTVGRRINFVYDEDQRIIQIEDPQNRKVKYQYDNNSDLIAVTDVNGGVTRYEYDDNHFIVKSTDPKGYVIIENTYDSEGRVLTQKDGREHTSYYSYDTVMKRTRYTNNKGVQTIFEYDGEFRPTAEIRSTNGTREEIKYNFSGNRSSITDFKGNKTYFTYDSRGNLTGLTDPAGNNISFLYDNNDNVTCSVDAKGYATYYNYDARGNLTAVTDPMGKTQTYQYDNFGQPVKMVDRFGAETVIEYDNEGNILLVTDPRGGKTKYGYDST